MPNFGVGRPPKLDGQQQEQLLELLREGQPWKKQEIQHLINEEFSVEFHPVYLSTFLTNLGLSYVIPQTKRPSRPENAEEILAERVADVFDESQTKEQICDCLEKICEQNPGKRILLVLDNFSSHVCEYTRSLDVRHRYT